MSCEPGDAAFWRRWSWRRWLLAGLAVPLVLFGLSNLWLATPPGRGWLAARIAARVGLPATLGPVTWSPWRGLTLRDLGLTAPAEAGLPAEAREVLRVRRIVVIPRWGELARGALAAASIEVDQPDLQLPFELLVALAGPATAPPPPPPAPPPVLAGPPPGAAPPGATPGVPAGPPSAPVPPPPPQQPAAPPVAAAKLPPTSWLIIRGGRVRSGSARGRRDWLSVAGINAAIPVRGVAAQGSLHIRECMLADQSLGGAEVGLKWEQPRLAVPGWRPQVAGIDGVVSAQVVLDGSCPFYLAMIMPEQAATLGPEGCGPRVAAARAAGLARLIGHGRIPASWQGDLAFDAAGVHCHGMPGGAHAFDRCRLRASARGGAVRVSDLRAIGESLSVLGNGLALTDGRLLAVLRMVLPEEAAAGAGRLVAPLTSDGSGGFRPLETRDRWFIDCLIGGNFAAPQIQAGASPPYPLGEWIEALGRRGPGT